MVEVFTFAVKTTLTVDPLVKVPPDCETVKTGATAGHRFAGSEASQALS